MNATSPWAWWQAALKGNVGPIHENEPQQGFYRAGNDPVAIWYDEKDGVMAKRWERLLTAAQACEVWTWACRKPISHALYTEVLAGGQWPEAIDAEVAAAKPAEPALGHNSGLPHEEVLDELAAIEAAFAAWLKSIGSISTGSTTRRPRRSSRGSAPCRRRRTAFATARSGRTSKPAARSTPSGNRL
jgi:hypothetical protein